MIRIGTSGFSFADWRGPVYPPGFDQKEMLGYYETALGFDTVEINYTYYTLPSVGTMQGLLRKTSSGFQFVVRSHKDMTHEIWADEKRTTFKDNREVFAQFAAGIAPLHAHGRLGCILVQMPSFFWPSTRSEQYLVGVRERLDPLPLVIEFRNRAWLSDRTFRFLTEHGLGYCVVDEPPLPRLLPFLPRATSDIAYFRFHGRNQNWFMASREERYDYLYSRSELDELVPAVRDLAASRPNTYVFFNNCHAGAAARNALMTKEMLGLVAELTPLQQAVVEGQSPR